jgi:hypothetical protein
MLPDRSRKTPPSLLISRPSSRVARSIAPGTAAFFTFSFVTDIPNYILQTLTQEQVDTFQQYTNEQEDLFRQAITEECGKFNQNHAGGIWWSHEAGLGCTEIGQQVLTDCRPRKLL